MERIVFQTADRVAIVGDFLMAPPPAGGSIRAVLLLHMMPADRKSWHKLQEALHDRGVASLAIDLRGHGESLVQDGRRLDYRAFDDEQHQGYLEDVRAALSWLRSRGFEERQVLLVGASIGANAALAIAAEKSAIPAVALLSPGENFRGIATYDAAERLRPEQAIWIAASEGDDQESFDAMQEIIRRAPSTEKMAKPFASAGHGTHLFTIFPKLVDELADWLAHPRNA